MTDNPITNAGTYDLLGEDRQKGISFASSGEGIKAAPDVWKDFGRAAAKKPAAPLQPAPASYDQLGMGNKFLVNLMLMLVQLLNPDGQNGGLMSLITQAFGLGKDDENHSTFRQLKSQTATTEGREQFRKNHNYSNFNNGAAREAMRQGADILSKNGPQNPDERQSRVMAVMDDAAKSAGISSKLMIGVWGYESSWGTNLKSPTGCQGDFQFTRTTMADVLSKDGNKIAERLRAQGKTAEAKTVESIYTQTAGMNGDQIKSFASRNTAQIDTLRNNPEVSTYAAAYYLKSVSKDLKVDPGKTENFGLIYAGYNIGVGHALTIKNGGRATGWEVDANAGVAGRGNQAASYQNAMESRINGATGRIVAEKITTTAAFAPAASGAPKPPATDNPIVVASTPSADPAPRRTGPQTATPA